ncbi:MAG: ABC transporter substrate-binding protein [Saprospiraceae bacterium]|nr:ABC transporter substrate-binding protein [Saprospiraceae bacterium]
MSIRSTVCICTLVFLSSTFFAFQNFAGLTPSQERGKLIYTQGKRVSGTPIKASMSGANFDAMILPCVNCHGEKGIGNAEGGIIPTPVRWSTLTQSYTIEFKNGRKRIAYTENTIGKVIKEGIDPSGNEIDKVMPRYELSDSDVEDLIAYFKVLGNESITGVSDTSIVVGMIVPPNNHPPGRSQTMINTVRAYVDLVNMGGGIYNRKIQVKELVLDNNAQKSDSLVSKFLSDENTLAFVSSDIESLSQSSVEYIEKSKIPIIGAVSGNPKNTDYLKNEFYYLLPGIIQQIQVLQNFSIENLNVSKENFIILYDNSLADLGIELKEVVVDQQFRYEKIKTDNNDFYNQMIDLKSEGIKHCLLLSSINSNLSMLNTMQQLEWFPTILIPGKFASSKWLDAPMEMNQKIYFSYPTWLSERNEKAMVKYYSMAKAYNLDKDYKSAQIQSLSSIILFTEVLKLVGNDVDRTSLITQLQDLNSFQSGFIPPLSFGPNKRIGSEKVFILKANLEKKELELVN